MAKKCTTEKTANRQRWMENGLLELMQSYKFEEITVTDLCQHLNLSRRSFYRYFDNMDDVLDSLMHHIFQQMSIHNASMTLPAMELTYEFWFQHKDLLNALAYSGMHTTLAQYALKYSNADALRTYLSDEDLALDLVREMNLFVVSGLCSLLISWHAEGFQKSPSQMAQISQRMLCSPLLQKP